MRRIPSNPGGITAKNLEAFCYTDRAQKPLAVFNLSATPRVEELDYSMTLVRGISRGIVSPVQARLIRDNYDDGGQDSYENEIHRLMNNEKRNNRIVHEILSGLASGQSVRVGPRQWQRNSSTQHRRKLIGSSSKYLAVYFGNIVGKTA